MPKIVIDDMEIEVAPGTKVIQAAEQLGIMIPRFCYHPALGSVGACRVCAVKFLHGPFKGVQMSCMITSLDGMVVSTTDEEVVDFRRHVIEWLMLNHPHDCPVCDEGGHCLLQDLTVSGGHGIRSYLGNKRTYPDQYLGPLLQHEMNRCIHCYRCSRFYQEFTGYRDLGAMQSANRTYFGRFRDGILESPFSGNLSDICPTGVYTDKPSRFFGRRWDYQRAASLCIACSLGCHTIASARYRRVVRQEARFSAVVNGYFVCDRGRYSHFYAGLEDRPRRAAVDGREVSYDQAVRTADKRLSAIARQDGPRAVACVGSMRNSLETQAMAKWVCRSKEWRVPAFFVQSSEARTVKRAATRLEPDLAVSLHEVEDADFILVIGADPLNEAPMLALALRQAARKGAEVVALDPRPMVLPFRFQHIAMGPRDIPQYLGGLARGCLKRETVETFGPQALAWFDDLKTPGEMAASARAALGRTTATLSASQRPIIICGTEVMSEGEVDLAADFARLLSTEKRRPGLMYVLPGAGAFSAGLLMENDESLEQILSEIEGGSVKALILVESNPFWCFPDRQRLEQAFEKLDLLIVIDYLECETVQRAHVFLPAATLYETGAVFINQEARVQAALPVIKGGTPISQTGGGSHPPRSYGAGLPGGDPRAAWMILNELANDQAPSDFEVARAHLCDRIKELIPGLGALSAISDIPPDGVRLQRDGAETLRFAPKAGDGDKAPSDRGENFDVVLVDRTFGSEELSSYSACIRELERKPCVMIQLNDAHELGLRNGDAVEIEAKNGAVEATLCVKENMASGTLFMPRNRQIMWQKLGAGRTRIAKDRIRKLLPLSRE
jgi:NADH-quinone oxidoreductase subunit G